MYHHSHRHLKFVRQEHTDACCHACSCHSCPSLLASSAYVVQLLDSVLFFLFFPFFSSFFVISADRRSRRCAISVDGDDENSRDFARRATRKNAFSCDALVKAWRRPRQALAVTFQSLGCRHPVTNGAFAPRLPPIHLIHCTAQMRVLRSARHTA